MDESRRAIWDVLDIFSLRDLDHPTDEQIQQMACQQEFEIDSELEDELMRDYITEKERGYGE